MKRARNLRLCTKGLFMLYVVDRRSRVRQYQMSANASDAVLRDPA